MNVNLPQPSCPLGYTEADLDAIFPSWRERARFNSWMVGQTICRCEGRRYNHELSTYQPDECAGKVHGFVTYTWDVERYVRGLPIVD